MLTRDAERPAYLASTISHESITVIEAVSAGGNVKLLMVIIKGKVHQQHWYTHTDMDDSYLVRLLDSGYTNDHLCSGLAEALRKVQQTRRM